MKPFEKDMKRLHDEGILKKHNGGIGHYMEYRLLCNLPNSKSESDHPEFELKVGKYGSQITWASLADNYLIENFMDTKLYKKCKSLVFIPWKKIDGEKKFIGFHHIRESDWQKYLHDFENDWNLIKEYIDVFGIDHVKQVANSNFVPDTKYLKLYRCRDRIDEDGNLKKPGPRIRVPFSLIREIIENV